MKKILKFFIIVILSLFAFTSCTNEFSEPVFNQEIKLVKDPDVIVYSGSHKLGTTLRSRGSNVNGNLWYQEWKRPTNVTQEEIDKVLAAVADPRVGATNNIHIDWENYWVQQVWTGDSVYTDGYGNSIGTGSSHMNHLLAYNSNYEEEIWWPEHTINKGGYEHINNFNSGSNETVYTDDITGEQFIGTTLMTNMDATGIVNQFGYHNSTDSKNHFEYIIVEVDGEYYICFDFYATHPDGQDANKNMDVERDWVFNDWIVKISPAYPIEDTPEIDEPEIPETPEVSEGVIETNLHIDSKNGEYLESHLSIHVKAPTDVEVFIPVPIQYYCEADDMAIVNKHEPNHMIHGGPYTTTYTLQDGEEGPFEVTLNIEFKDNGIRIWTDGINEDVINFCYKHYQDGITFEVWNYFNEVLTLEGLKEYLDQTTITFLDTIPDIYKNTMESDNDCYVTD